VRALLLLLLILPSCRFMDNFSRAIETGVELKEQYHEFVAEAEEFKEEVKSEIVAAKAEMDANNDGHVSADEFFNWILGGGLVTLLGSIGLLIRNGKSNERKAKNEAKTEAAEQAAREAKELLAKLAGAPGFLDAATVKPK